MHSFLRPKTPEPLPVTNLTYEQRAELTENKLSKRIFGIMAKKETNLCLSADVENKKALLELANNAGPHICMLKIHYDIVEDWDQDTIDQLVALAKQHNFIIFEDRKFADIGNTVEAQYGRGKWKIADWATMVNLHGLPGPGILEAIKAIALPKGNGILLLAEMSSKGNLLTKEYTAEMVKWANANKDVVNGFIAQHTISGPDMIVATPGVELKEIEDNLGQQYNHPEKLVAGGADILIVGRAVCKYAAKKEATDAERDEAAKKVIAEAERYKTEGWKAYLQRSTVENRVEHVAQPM